MEDIAVGDGEVAVLPDLDRAHAVIHTDAALGRKQPIAHNFKVANQREHADALLDAWIEENIKKGWVKDE